MNFYRSWNHFRHSLQKCYRQILSQRDKLTEQQKTEARTYVSSLQQAIETKNKPQAYRSSKELEKFCSGHFKKPWYKSTIELILALSIALAVASIVRAMWFEPYEIPTGSMRPTFREQDHLTVSKAQFGINIPFKTDHFYFDPDLVKRTGIVIFSGDQLSVLDSDTSFLGIFPYKKRYIKRLIGKPGDTLYFYGGKIYGIDSSGNEIRELLDNPKLDKIEHIPFISFVGHLEPNAKTRGEYFFKHMNMPLGRVRATALGPRGEIFNGKNWIEDEFSYNKNPHQDVKTMSDFWGIGNFGMSELLTRKQLEEELKADAKKIPNGELYLLIRHHPSMGKYSFPNEDHIPLIGMYPFVEKSVIPLSQDHLDAIMENMYTMRFVVKNGRAKRYSLEEHPFSTTSPKMENVPDGTYEFYYGKAYKVLWGGFLKELPADHPLYDRSLSHVQQLYNLGMNMDRSYEPSRNHPLLLPSRYAYFRDGDLYLLGAPVLKKEDQALLNFVNNEEEKEKNSSYVAFKDRGAPIQDGKIDKELIHNFGLKIPEKNYFVLGDNHAMSSDSRIFGFVPEENLQGVPEVVLWPDSRFPNQPGYPTFVFSRFIVWALMGTIALIWYSIYRYRIRRPIDINKI